MTTPLAAAAALLSARAGRPVRLEAPTLLKSWARNDVWRASVAGGESVIVKHFKSEPARGFDEWAALALLTETPIEALGAPRFLGGDMAARCFVMADLGAGPRLEDLLNARDAGARERAAAALVEIARLTARLHVAMRGGAAAFDRRRDELAPRPLTPAAAAAGALRGRGADLEAWLRAVEVPRPAPIGAAGATLARFVEEPGEWTTLTHGDMAPSNTLRAVDSWCLLDFEYAGVRPALYDALLWTLFCPFPADLIEGADHAYREALAAGFPAARDEHAYGAARARVAAWRVLDLLHWQRPALLEADQPWAPGIGARGAVLWHLARFHRLSDAPCAAADPAVAPVAAATRRLERALHARWGEAPDAAAVWPAFREHRV